MNDLRHTAEALIAAHTPMLRGWLLHLLGTADDADDVLQEICVAVLANPELLLRGVVPGAYLRGIARHLALRHHHQRQRERAMQELIEEHWVADEPQPTEVAAEHAAAEHAALGVCLQALPQRWRTLLDLRYRAGLSAVAISERLAERDDGIRAALMRARQTLQRCIEQRLAKP